MMNRTISLAVAAGFAASFGLGGVAFADHKAGHPVPPGHDRACLIETSGGASGTIVSAKWLPRKAAEAQADDDTTFVGTHPDAQTQEGCEAFNPD